VLAFEDHDGTRLELIEDPAAPEGRAFVGADVPADRAIRGFHSATFLLGEAAPTRELLTGMYGYRVLSTEGPRTRLVASGTPGADAGLVIDLVEDPSAPLSRLGAGVVHHIALRASGDAEQRSWHAEARRRGLNVSPVMDRTYFRSIYMREPGGVLIEVATDGPGFAIDEPIESLGASLRLPAQYEPSRAAIEAHLPPLKR
jgi:glyoxalase family protein